MQIFTNVLEPLLKEHRIFYEVRVTKKPKEVEEFLRSSPIQLREKYSAIVILSGDGLLFEAIQGLFQRATSLTSSEDSTKNKVRNSQKKTHECVFTEKKSFLNSRNQ